MVLGLDLDMTCLDGLLAMDLNWGLPCWLIGYGLRLGFEIAYLCGLLAVVLKFGFDKAYLCGYLDGLWLHLVFGFDIHPEIGYGFELNLAYLCGFLAMDLKFGFGFEYGLPCWLIGYGLRLGFEIAYLCGLLAVVLKFGFDKAYLCGYLDGLWLHLVFGFDIHPEIGYGFELNL
ncbi:hypothetical protein Taro_047479, partial [Colocasia esculenta]|nr:hypothetical protein [Colocasia esculenta]